MSEKIEVAEGVYIEGERAEERNTPFHIAIASAERIAGTRSGRIVTLVCGHKFQTFGDLAHAEGKILCVYCRTAAGGAV
jgi:hypothetical protein